MLIGNDVLRMNTFRLMSQWCGGAGNNYRSLSGGQKLFHLEIEQELKYRGYNPTLIADQSSPTGFRAELLEEATGRPVDPATLKNLDDGEKIDSEEPE